MHIPSSGLTIGSSSITGDCPYCGAAVALDKGDGTWYECYLEILSCRRCEQKYSMEDRALIKESAKRKQFKDWKKPLAVWAVIISVICSVLYQTGHI